MSQELEGSTIKLERFKAMDPEERKRREIHALRVASEKNRRAVESGAVDEHARTAAQTHGTSFSEQAYWFFHRTYFDVAKDPFRVPDADHVGEGVQPYYNDVTDEMLDSAAGQYRKIQTSVGSFSNLHSRDLPETAQSFFSSIDRVISSEHLKKEEILFFLSLVDLIELILHMPFDASGRTDEDFLVWLANKYNFEMSISKTGYRGFVTPSIEKYLSRARSQVRKALGHRAGYQVLIDQSAPTEAFAAVDNKEKNTDVCSILEHWVGDQGEALYYQKLLEEAQILIRSLEKFSDKKKRPEIMRLIRERYPRIMALQAVYRHAHFQKFVYVPESIASLCDLAISYNLGTEIVQKKTKLSKLFRFLKGGKLAHRLVRRLNEREVEKLDQHEMLNLIRETTQSNNMIKVRIPRVGTLTLYSRK